MYEVEMHTVKSLLSFSFRSPKILQAAYYFSVGITLTIPAKTSAIVRSFLNNALRVLSFETLNTVIVHVHKDHWDMLLFCLNLISSLNQTQDRFYLVFCFLFLFCGEHFSISENSDQNITLDNKCEDNMNAVLRFLEQTLVIIPISDCFCITSS